VSNEIADLQASLRQFAEERDWRQFHSPKNLATALVVEAGELLEHFQWLTEDQSRTIAEDAVDSIADEIADVFIYLLELSSALGIEPLGAARKKIIANGLKYPVALAKGRMTKYTDL
jgi:NTP pyrophosphatase (non-canonical NTP hydrolase)